MAGEHTILLSSHILSEVQNTCDHIVIIHQGKIVEQGTYDEIVRGADSGRMYVVSVAREVEGFVSKLKKLNGLSAVTIVSSKAGSVEFRLDASVEYVDEVARLALDGGHGLREISSRRKSLEEVFVKLTH